MAVDLSFVLNRVHRWIIFGRFSKGATRYGRGPVVGAGNRAEYTESMKSIIHFASSISVARQARSISNEQRSLLWNFEISSVTENDTYSPYELYVSNQFLEPEGYNELAANLTPCQNSPNNTDRM